MRSSGLATPRRLDGPGGAGSLQVENDDIIELRIERKAEKQTGMGSCGPACNQAAMALVERSEEKWRARKDSNL